MLMAKSDAPDPPDPDDIRVSADEQADLDIRDTSTELRRFWCTECGETSKMVDTDDYPNGHETGIYTGCENCGPKRPHLPDHGRPLAFYRWLEAHERQGNYTWSEDTSDDEEEDDD
jgi:hypothetical protein